MIGNSQVSSVEAHYIAHIEFEIRNSGLCLILNNWLICLQSIDFIKKLILLMAEQRIYNVDISNIYAGYCSPAILIDQGQVRKNVAQKIPTVESCSRGKNAKTR